ncbi:MAG TPA: SgcJ/EcaC family oxidoreductase [Gemmatimonadales bacterium]|nr:SgcJ/EcaC family oxidoreductase [Gemmatimonadales bacterium]
MRLLTVLCLFIAPPLMAQGASAGPDPAAARRAIDAGNTEYRAAFLAMDAARLANVYDPRGARLGERGEVVRGRSAIARDVAAFVAKAGPVTVTIETAQVWTIDDTAYETGAWSYTYHPKDAAEQRIGGRYVTLWRRQPDGGWKIWADMGVPGT